MATGKPTDTEPGKEGRQIQPAYLPQASSRCCCPSQRQSEQMFPPQLTPSQFRRRRPKGLLSGGFPRHTGRAGQERREEASGGSSAKPSGEPTPQPVSWESVDILSHKARRTGQNHQKPSALCHLELGTPTARTQTIFI